MSTESKLVHQLNEAKAAVLAKCPTFPPIVVVLGSGLAGLLDRLEKETEIAFTEIPHVQNVTVEGHVGRIVIGKLEGVRVACLQGRLHYYEGYRMDEVVFPHRVMAWAGAEIFLLTNATGGLKPEMKSMDLMLIRDHINFMGNNPLIGKNDSLLGPRFPDMTALYDRELGAEVLEAAKEVGMTLHEGVYVGLHGPSFETPAEIRMYRALGGDVTGMSTIPEAIALHHMGKRVVGISCITNLAAGISPFPLTHEEVIENAKKAYPQFSKLIVRSLKRFQGVL